MVDWIDINGTSVEIPKEIEGDMAARAEFIAGLTGKKKGGKGAATENTEPPAAPAEE